MRTEIRLFRLARFILQVALGVGVLVAGVLILGSLFLVRQVPPDEAWRMAERELRASVLRYGEQPQRIARVYRRKATSYFGKSNGLLVATPSRLVFVGIEPKINLAEYDSPAPITTTEVPNDTLLRLSRRRVYGWLASGVVVQRAASVNTVPRNDSTASADSSQNDPFAASGIVRATNEQYAAQGGYEWELDSLVQYVNAQNAWQRQDAARERGLRTAIAELIRRPLYYEIKRGDALLNIANRFGTTPDQLRAWNNLQGDRVRIRDTLLVKPAGP